jgi:hypothetical protein
MHLRQRCSVDSTEKIIDRFIEKNTRFLKINQANGGVSMARNAGRGMSLDERGLGYFNAFDRNEMIDNSIVP